MEKGIEGVVENLPTFIKNFLCCGAIGLVGGCLTNLDDWNTYEKIILPTSIFLVQGAGSLIYANKRFQKDKNNEKSEFYVNTIINSAGLLNGYCMGAFS